MNEAMGEYGLNQSCEECKSLSSPCGGRHGGPRQRKAGAHTSEASRLPHGQQATTIAAKTNVLT